MGIRRWDEHDYLEQSPKDSVQLIPAPRPGEEMAAIWRSSSCSCRSARTMLSCRSCNVSLRHRFKMPENPGMEYFVGCGSCKWRGPCGGGNCCKTRASGGFKGDEPYSPSLKAKEDMAAAALLDAVAVAAAGQETEGTESEALLLPPPPPSPISPSLWSLLGLNGVNDPL